MVKRDNWEGRCDCERCQKKPELKTRWGCESEGETLFVAGDDLEGVKRCPLVLFAEHPEIPRLARVFGHASDGNLAVYVPSRPTLWTDEGLSYFARCLRPKK